MKVEISVELYLEGRPGMVFIKGKSARKVAMAYRELMKTLYPPQKAGGGKCP